MGYFTSYLAKQNLNMIEIFKNIFMVAPSAIQKYQHKKIIGIVKTSTIKIPFYFADSYSSWGSVELARFQILYIYIAYQ